MVLVRVRVKFWVRQGRRREEGICPNTKSVIYVLIDWPYVL